MNLLLTGKPGIGKTSVVEAVVAQLRRRGLRLAGFFTRELRNPSGERIGFKIITLDGEEGELARVGLHSPARVGRYGVNLDDLERLALPRLRARNVDLIVIDEIGKMECASAGFRRAVEDALDAPVHVLATLGIGRMPFFEALRARPDVKLWEVTGRNRARLPEELLACLGG